MRFLATNVVLHDLIVTELLEQKSLAALIYLINSGRELEFNVNDKQYFISRDKAEKYVSIWDKINEQSFDSVAELIENAIIGDKPFLSVWKDVEIETLF